MNFADRMITEIKKKQTPLIVGLDPRFQQLPEAVRQEVQASPKSPEGLRQIASAFESFCRDVLDVVAPLVPAVKPQMAFFEQLGPHGMSAVANVINYAASLGVLVILDGKRNDIGSTAEAYAEAYLGRWPKSSWGADALTVNPWMGCDSLEPFVARCQSTDSGLFVLVKTSNPGSEDFQGLISGGRRLYQLVGEQVERMASRTLGTNGYGSVGAVVGATYPEQLGELRAAMPRSYFLVPGFGAQGGSAADVAAAFDSTGLGAVINSSRAIIFAHETPAFASELSNGGWQRCVETATKLAKEMLAKDTPAGKLTQID